MRLESQATKRLMVLIPKYLHKMPKTFWSLPMLYSNMFLHFKKSLSNSKTVKAIPKPPPNTASRKSTGITLALPARASVMYPILDKVRWGRGGSLRTPCGQSGRLIGLKLIAAKWRRLVPGERRDGAQSRPPASSPLSGRSAGVLTEYPANCRVAACGAYPLQGATRTHTVGPQEGSRLTFIR